MHNNSRDYMSEEVVEKSCLRRVTRGSLEDKAVVSTLLVEAFSLDPVLSFCVRNDDKKREALFSFFSDLRETTSETYLHDEGKGVVTLFFPGVDWRVPLFQGVRNLPRLFRVAGYSYRKVSRMMKLSNAFMSHHPAQRHFYLQGIAVHPKCQGSGTGSKLLRSVILIADNAKFPIYLECTHARQVSFYERHGFKVQKRLLPFGLDGPGVWLMWREPGAEIS